MVVYTGRLHGRDGRLHVYTAVHGCAQPVHGGVGAVFTAVFTNTACTRQYTRIYGPYTKPVECATSSQTVVIISVNKARQHIDCHRKFIKYGVK